MIMSILLAVVWSSFNSAVQHLDGDVQACLITICAGFVGGAFYNLIVREREIRDEWEPEVGLLGGCLLVLLVALIVASLQLSAPSPVSPATPIP
jgi:peptidoglycan/LPS O-acetylase OafA/YrhL